MSKKEIEKKTIKDKLRIVGNKVKFVVKFIGSKIKYGMKVVGSEVKHITVLPYLKLRNRIDQHSKISQYKKDIEKLTEEKIIVGKEHFQEMSLLETSIEILEKERNELKAQVAVLNKSLDIKINDLIKAKANLLILERENE